MTGLASAELSQIPMSQSLAATLARASDGARATGSAEIALEHVLAALCDDADAADVLNACQIDPGALRAEVINYLAHAASKERAGSGDVVVSAPVKRILEAAAAAARGGRRRDINGAIVLAAIVGDGRSVAAQILQRRGLTFDGAIRALQTAMAQPQRDAPYVAPAEDVLARARERVQSRSAPSLRDIIRDMPRTAANPVTPPVAPTDIVPAAPMPAPVPRPTDVAPASSSRAPQAAAVAQDRVEMTAPAADALPRAAPNMDAVPAPSSANDDLTDHPAEPAKAETSARSEAELQPEAKSEAAKPAAPPSPPPATSPAPPSPSGGFFPPASEPLRHAGASTGPGPIASPAPMPSARPAAVTPPPIPPPIPPHPPSVAPSGYGVPMPPRAPGATSMPPAGNAGSLPPFGGTPAGVRPPPPPSPGQQPMPPPMRKAQGPATPARREAPVKAEMGELAENVPRAMRVGISERIEIRIARGRVRALTEGMEGGGLAWRHDVTVTKAMSVRLRAPEGGFFIETASPETQWIDSQFQDVGDDYASWRFLVTPNRRGLARLQIIVSARTVGADGLAAETAFPDQVIDVKVKSNLKRAALRWGGWIAAAVLGGLLSKVGEGTFEAGAAMVKKIIG